MDQRLYSLIAGVSLVVIFLLMMYPKIFAGQSPGCSPDLTVAEMEMLFNTRHAVRQTSKNTASLASLRASLGHEPVAQHFTTGDWEDIEWHNISQSDLFRLVMQVTKQAYANFSDIRDLQQERRNAVPGSNSQRTGGRYDNRSFQGGADSDQAERLP